MERRYRIAYSLRDLHGAALRLREDAYSATQGSFALFVRRFLRRFEVFMISVAGAALFRATMFFFLGIC